MLNSNLRLLTFIGLISITLIPYYIILVWALWNLTSGIIKLTILYWIKKSIKHYNIKGKFAKHKASKNFLSNVIPLALRLSIFSLTITIYIFAKLSMQETPIYRVFSDKYINNFYFHVMFLYLITVLLYYTTIDFSTQTFKNLSQEKIIYTVFNILISLTIIFILSQLQVRI